MLLMPLSLSAQSCPSLTINVTYPQLSTPRRVPFRLSSLPIVASRVVPTRHWRPVVRFYPRSRYNCVWIVRNAGFAVPRSTDGFARTIPVSSKGLPPEGKLVVIKTSESRMGHVLVARRVGNVLTSVVDSVGKGRIIPLSVYRGYI